MDSIKNFFRNIFRTILFLGILVLLLSLVSKGIVHQISKDERKMPLRNRAFIKIGQEEPNTLDVMFLGDSLSYRTFSPMVMWDNYGYTSFVCGQNGQLIQESYYLLKTALEEQKPKVVYFETNVMFRKQKDMDKIETSVAECEKYYLPIVRYHDQWKSVVGGKVYSEESYKGYCMVGKVKKYSGKSKMINKYKNDMQPVVKEYMKKIIKLCNDNDVKLELVSIPSPKNYSSTKHNYIEKYAKENNLNYLDMNYLDDKEIGIDWETDTYDAGDHLNVSGAQKVSKYFGQYIQNRYHLTDRRNDAKYASWNELHKKYVVDSDKMLADIEKVSKKQIDLAKK